MIKQALINQDTFDLHQLRVKDSHWGKVSKNVERNYTLISKKGNKSKLTDSKIG